MWTWIIIVVGYAVSLFFFRIVGGINSAADAISNWGRTSSTRRLARQGLTPSEYARRRLNR